MSDLKNLQQAFTHHLRDPDHIPVPEGLDKRRVGIYSELIFNNISALLTDFFPVIHSILPASAWDQMVRNFFVTHQSQTPYFMELSGEFVNYLSLSQMDASMPGFITELAHYEWVELALYTMDEELPESNLPEDDLLSANIALSPLAQPLVYQYPVHQIRPEFQPSAPGAQPTYLLVFRDSSESVRFFELQPLSFHLLHEIQQNPGLNVGSWLHKTGTELSVPDIDEFISNGSGLLQSFNENNLLIRE